MSTIDISEEIALEIFRRDVSYVKGLHRILSGCEEGSKLWSDTVIDIMIARKRINELANLIRAIRAVRKELKQQITLLTTEAYVRGILHERNKLDSRLGDALRASGINAEDAQAVQTLYAVAGHTGAHRIVSAMRGIEAWIKEGSEENDGVRYYRSYSSRENE